MSETKKALIFQGGWDGHEPALVARRFKGMLERHGYACEVSDTQDVLADAENQAIGDRSFGTDPQVVASMAWVFAEALHHNGILAAYKHFPGHGDTKEDSHSGYAYVHKTLEELRQTELVPFQDGCDRGRGFHHGVPYLWPRRSQAATCRPLCPEVWWRIC